MYEIYVCMCVCIYIYTYAPPKPSLVCHVQMNMSQSSTRLRVVFSFTIDCRQCKNQGLTNDAPSRCWFCAYVRDFLYKPLLAYAWHRGQSSNNSVNSLSDSLFGFFFSFSLRHCYRFPRRVGSRREATIHRDNRHHAFPFCSLGWSLMLFL